MSLNWNALSKGDLSWKNEKEKDDRKKQWSSIYKDIEDVANFTNEFLDMDLERFKTQSGKDRLAISSTRIKSDESFTEKLLSIGEERNVNRLYKKFSKKKPTMSIFELINDLVGARLVFYFERDIQDAALYWLSYPVFIPVEIIDWNQDTMGLDRDGIKWWRKELPQGKASGYESLHFVIRFDTDMLYARLKARIDRMEHGSNDEIRWEGLYQKLKKPGFLEKLKYVHFEVQCRTILEHTWAEVEHRSNYSFKKVGYSVSDPDLSLRKFRSYKAILRSAQILQNTFRSGFSRWDEKRDFIIGRNTYCELGPRDVFWKENLKERQSVNYLQVLFKSALNDAEIWEKIFEDIDKLFEKIPLKKRVLSTEMVAEDYGKIRLLYLYLGFVLGYCPHTDIDKDKADTYSKFREKVAGYFCELQFPECKEFHIPTEAIAIRAYETIRLLDEYHALKETDYKNTYFYDPLVSVRLASVYYRHFGAFRRSTQLYKEALEMVECVNAELVKGSVILTKEYIGKRIAENLWTAYHLDGHRPEDLVGALESAKNTYKLLLDESNQLTTQEGKIKEIRQTLPGLILTIMLAYVRQKQYVSTVFGCSEDVLKKVVQNVNLLVDEYGFKDAFSKNYEVMVEEIKTENGKQHLQRSLKLQGLAIWIACQVELDGNHPEVGMFDARRYIRKARNNVADKVQKNRGGAIPFHEDVARDVEEFIYALPFEDITLVA